MIVLKKGAYPCSRTRTPPENRKRVQEGHDLLDLLDIELDDLFQDHDSPKLDAPKAHKADDVNRRDHNVGKIDKNNRKSEHQERKLQASPTPSPSLSTAAPTGASISRGISSSYSDFSSSEGSPSAVPTAAPTAAPTMGE